MPDDELLEQAARAALKAEIDYIRTARKTAFCMPASDQVKRLIAAAWPVLAAAGDGNG